MGPKLLTKSALLLTAFLGSQVYLPSASADVDVLNLLGPDRDAQADAETLGAPLDLSLTWKPPPDGLMEALAAYPEDELWEGCQQRIHELHTLLQDEAFVDPPLSSDGLFSALVEQARAQNRFLYHDEALYSVAQAIEWLPCTDSRVESEQLTELYLQEAIAHIYLYDGFEKSAFQSLLSVNPEAMLAPDHPSIIKLAFRDAAVRSADQPVIPLSKVPEGFTLYIDGQARRSSVTPGYHVLQLLGPDQRLRTRTVPIYASETALDLLTLANFSVYEPGQSLEHLQRVFLTGETDQKTRDLLDSIIAKDEDFLVAAVQDPQSNTPRLSLYKEGVGVVSDDASWAAWTSQVAPPPPQEIVVEKQPETQTKDGFILGAVTAGMRLYPTDSGPLTLHQQRAGYRFQGTTSTPLTFGSRALFAVAEVAIYPHLGVTEDLGSGCGDSTATASELAPCQSSNTPVSGALGMGATLVNIGRWAVNTVLKGEANYLPGTFADAGDGSGLLIGTGFALGPTLELALSRPGVKAGSITPTLSASGGYHFLFAGPQTMWAMPLSIHGGLSFTL